MTDEEIQVIMEGGCPNCHGNPWSWTMGIPRCNICGATPPPSVPLIDGPDVNLETGDERETHRSAEEDYPYLAGCVPGTQLTNEIQKALSEINKLRMDVSTLLSKLATTDATWP